MFRTLAPERAAARRRRAKRELAGENVIVAGYCSDVMGYIPSRRVLQEGGYEAVDNMIYYGQPGPFTDSVEETVFAALHRVAERVGVTKPLIYEYFGSKEGLLSACIDKARTQLRDATVAAWQGIDEGAALETYFESGIRAFFDFIDEHASAFALIQQEGAVAASASSTIIGTVSTLYGELVLAGVEK